MLHKTLKLIRLFHAITQKELAEQLKISRSHICEIERGKTKPSLDLLAKYANYFKVPASNLLFFSEYLNNKNTMKINQISTFIAPQIISMMEIIKHTSIQEKK